MLKGHACVKGYTHTGRDCAGCTGFEEEKIHMQPQCLLPPEACSEFLEELEGLLCSGPGPDAAEAPFIGVF